MSIVGFSYVYHTMYAAGTGSITVSMPELADGMNTKGIMQNKHAETPVN